MTAHAKISWPADKVERWPIAKLVPNARNARTHSPEQIDQIAASIREWGWTNPVLVTEEGTIIAGHGRVLGARKLGLAEAPVTANQSSWRRPWRTTRNTTDSRMSLSGPRRDQSPL